MSTITWTSNVQVRDKARDDNTGTLYRFCPTTPVYWSSRKRSGKGIYAQSLTLRRTHGQLKGESVVLLSLGLAQAGQLVAAGFVVCTAVPALVCSVSEEK